MASSTQPDGLPELLEHLRDDLRPHLGRRARASEPGRPWEQVDGCAAGRAARCRSRRDVVIDVVADASSCALRGRPLAADDQRVITAYAAQVGSVLERGRLAAGRRARPHRLAAGNAVRTALLAAVSHDLRTPLAGIKAGVSSLRMDDVQWSPRGRGRAARDDRGVAPTGSTP